MIPFGDSEVLGRFNGEPVRSNRMGSMSELDHELQIICAIISEPDPVLSAAEQIERKIDWLVRELDELCRLANNAETRDLVAKEAIGVGQIQFRAGLILAFLDVNKPRLTVVSNVR